MKPIETQYFNANYEIHRMNRKGKLYVSFMNHLFFFINFLAKFNFGVHIFTEQNIGHAINCAFILHLLKWKNKMKKILGDGGFTATNYINASNSLHGMIKWQMQYQTVSGRSSRKMNVPKLQQLFSIVTHMGLGLEWLLVADAVQWLIDYWITILNSAKVSNLKCEHLDDWIRIQYQTHRTCNLIEASKYISQLFFLLKILIKNIWQ